MKSAIFTRASVREYTAEPVTNAQIREILYAAMCAPSAMNRRNWHFVVITQRETLDKIIAVHPYATALKTAGTAVCVVGEDATGVAGYYQQDCAAAVENMLIAAEEMGLGSCWMGVAPREERMTAVREILGIPSDKIPFALVALGHAQRAHEERPERYEEARIYGETWGKQI